MMRAPSFVNDASCPIDLRKVEIAKRLEVLQAPPKQGHAAPGPEAA